MSMDSDYKKAYNDAMKVTKQIIAEYCRKNPDKSPSDDFSDISEVTTPIQKAYTEACENHGIDTNSNKFGVNCLYTVWELAGHKTR